MASKVDCRRAVLAAAVFLAVALVQGAQAQNVSPAGAAAGPAQFPGIPLKREPDSGDSVVGSLGWAVVLLAAMAGAAYLLVRGKQRAGQRIPWLRGLQRPVEGPSLPKSVGRSILTQQASLHVVEWHGEELLLGCTSHSVALLARHPIPAGTNDSKEKS